ncbi:hypothetical protein DP643_23075 [Salmonella enterica]|nr:hypothetical protein [Salmonella enterica]EBM0567284.1 hypothetical protein [Salmonella enterica]ECC2479354.1 hypothetical protein [Salmonella enterica]ECR9321150.1 hypothetical protein [Salmonella enterica]EDF8679174.1 hypothetical protein [Salmonella enterica]
MGEDVNQNYHHEKSRLVWEVLQDDDVIRRQLQAWWCGISRYLTLSFRYLPAMFLTSSGPPDSRDVAAYHENSAT